MLNNNDFTDIVIDDKQIRFPKNMQLVEITQYDRSLIPFRCKQGICGTCRVSVVEGLENISKQSEEEKSFLQSTGFFDEKTRLACQLTIHGPVTIVTRQDYGNNQV